MDKILTIFMLVAFLSGCALSNTGSNSSPESRLPHHTADTKGRSHFAATRPATGKKVFIFSPRATAWAAYDANGNRVKTGSASGGGNYCADLGRSCRTPSGRFAVYRKQGPECKSSRFPLPNGGARMPYCMHFHGGYAVHASLDVPNHNASHGCIRVLPSAAEWLNQDFMDYGTQVIVTPY